MDAASERNDAPSLPRNIVLHQGNRRVLVQCPDSYAGGVEMARSVFDLAHDPEDVGLWLDMTSMGQNSTLGPVEISPTAWSVVQLSTRTPLVWVDLKSRAARSGHYQTHNMNDTMKVDVYTSGAAGLMRLLVLEAIPRSYPVETVFAAVHAQTGAPIQPLTLVLLFNSQVIHPGSSQSLRDVFSREDAAHLVVTGLPEPFRARGLYDYSSSPDEPNDISFAKGDILEIVEKDGDWWKARGADGRVGNVPSNFLQII